MSVAFIQTTRGNADLYSSHRLAPTLRQIAASEALDSLTTLLEYPASLFPAEAQQTSLPRSR